MPRARVRNTSPAMMTGAAIIDTERLQQGFDTPKEPFIQPTELTYDRFPQQNIAFDWHGNLLDGRHRFWAKSCDALRPKIQTTA